MPLANSREVGRKPNSWASALRSEVADEAAQLFDRKPSRKKSWRAAKHADFYIMIHLDPILRRF